MAVTTVEEPILSRLDRLDTIVRKLKELKVGNSFRTPKSSSCASSPSSCTVGSEGKTSSFDFSPRSMEKHCRPIDDVIVETETKGTLIERLVHVEDRVAKLEEEIEAEKRRLEEEQKKKAIKKKRGLKQLVKSCVTGNGSVY